MNGNCLAATCGFVFLAEVSDHRRPPIKEKTVVEIPSYMNKQNDIFTYLPIWAYELNYSLSAICV